MGNKELGERWARQINSSGLVDTVFNYIDNITGPEPGFLAGFDAFTYNSYNNPVTAKRFELMAPEPFLSFAYYYELYDDEVSIGPKTRESNELAVYPNPYTRGLSVNWKDKAGVVGLSLVNMLGQEVYRSAVKLQQGANRLELPDLSNGVYMLTIRDADGKFRSSKIGKQ